MWAAGSVLDTNFRVWVFPWADWGFLSEERFTFLVFTESLLCGRPFARPCLWKASCLIDCRQKMSLQLVASHEGRTADQLGKGTDSCWTFLMLQKHRFFKGWGCDLELEYLPTMCKALVLIPSTTGKWTAPPQIFSRKIMKTQTRPQPTARYSEGAGPLFVNGDSHTKAGQAGSCKG
jgi:hypothetical protein